jgi:hypothetical protein
MWFEAPTACAFPLTMANIACSHIWTIIINNDGSAVCRATFYHNVRSPFLHARPPWPPRVKPGRRARPVVVGDHRSLGFRWLGVLIGVAAAASALVSHPPRCAIHQTRMHWWTDANDRGGTRVRTRKVPQGYGGVPVRRCTSRSGTRTTTENRSFFGGFNCFLWLGQ